MWIHISGCDTNRLYRCLSDFKAHLAEGGQYKLATGMKGTMPGIYEQGRQTLISTARVLLTKPKLYCGNHPGECLVGAPKRNTCFLEWDDHVVFNHLMNAFLDKWLAPGETAEVWSCPPEVPIPGTNEGRGNSKKFWVRRDNVPRKRYDWEEGIYQGRELRLWDFGSPSQFEGEEREAA